MDVRAIPRLASSLLSQISAWPLRFLYLESTVRFEVGDLG